MSFREAEQVEAEEAPAPSARAAQLARLSPARAALELAWPGIIEQSISALGTAAVFAFVGQLGATATAAVGAAGSFLFLMFPVWRSLAIGTVAVVSRRMGEGRAADAADATRQSLLLGGIAGAAFGVSSSSSRRRSFVCLERTRRSSRSELRSSPWSGPRTVWRRSG